MSSVIGRRSATRIALRARLLITVALVVACNGGPPPPSLALFAGNLGGPGNTDGIGAAARFCCPEGIATDPSGNIYVADTLNGSIRKLSPEGDVRTFVLVKVHGVATDSVGNVYVTGDYTIGKVTPAGVVSTLAGTEGNPGSADGIGAAASFNIPEGLAVDSAGTVYVADTYNHTIRKITPAGEVSTLAGAAGNSGSADGVGAAARFDRPRGLAVDSTGTVYVADTYNHTIRKITPAGEVSTLAGTAGNSGSADGVGAAARFNWPRCIAVDSVGNIYVGDLDNHTIRKITPSGQVTTLAGSPGIAGSTDGIGSAARFYEPDGVAIDYAGNVYVSDWHNSAIRKITSTGFVTTLAGSARVDGSADGVGPAARFAGPLGVGIDSVGNVYVADTGNSSIRRITPSGNVSTYAGAAGAFGRVDGIASEARFYQPSGVAIDNAGNVYVADTWNNVIRKITAAGMVSTLAGTGSIGSTDGNGDTASFGFCELVSVGHPGVTYVRVCDAAGIATDSAGNVYVADLFNNTIRKITPAGVVTTLAGSARIAGSADGVGSAARFNFPRGVATDNQVNVYVADTENHTIRKITPSGQVTTLAGSPGIAGSTDGIGSAARFNHPRGIATDGAGKVYVADTDNHTIRKIDSAGGVTTLVGVAGMIGFTPGALPGALANPQGVAVSGTTLYVTLFNGVAVVTNLQ